MPNNEGKEGGNKESSAKGHEFDTMSSECSKIVEKITDLESLVKKFEHDRVMFVINQKKLQDALKNQEKHEENIDKIEKKFDKNQVKVHRK